MPCSCLEFSSSCCFCGICFVFSRFDFLSHYFVRIFAVDFFALGLHLGYRYILGILVYVALLHSEPLLGFSVTSLFIFFSVVLLVCNAFGMTSLFPASYFCRVSSCPFWVCIFQAIGSISGAAVVRCLLPDPFPGFQLCRNS